jgi:phage regulator Rha-like protein
MKNLIPIERIAQKIYLIRGQKVMLDSDLAEFYGVQVKRLNEQVRRNTERFPENFMFRLNNEEAKSAIVSRSQFATLNRGYNIKYLPYAFTEHGVVMLSSVLKSKNAVQVSIAVVNAFVKMREYLATHKQILEKLKRHDDNFIVIFKVLKQLTDTPKKEAVKKTNRLQAIKSAKILLGI